MILQNYSHVRGKMKMKLFIISISFIAVSSLFSGECQSVGPRPSSGCKKTVAELNDAVTLCFRSHSVTSLQYVLPYFTNRQDLQQLCSEQSGILECLAESIRPCINNVTHMFYDVNNFRSVIESVCKNETHTIAAYTNCMAKIKLKSSFCLHELRKNTQVAIKENNTDTTTGICRSYQQMSVCMSLSPGVTCTSRSAEFVNNNFEIIYNFRRCNSSGVDGVDLSIELTLQANTTESPTLPSQSVMFRLSPYLILVLLSFASMHQTNA